MNYLVRDVLVDKGQKLLLTIAASGLSGKCTKGRKFLFASLA